MTSVITSSIIEARRRFVLNQKHDAHPILKEGVWESARVLDARKSLKIPGIFCTENCRHFEQFSSV
ncbi:MAG TPA: hypothetical protein VJK03_03765, partial [Candidatus Nanoarchaeia archaeon]|nr:hypothetical protein [Candidatus Nanoarchaeia archaeon]